MHLLPDTALFLVAHSQSSLERGGGGKGLSSCHCFLLLGHSPTTTTPCIFSKTSMWTGSQFHQQLVYISYWVKSLISVCFQPSCSPGNQFSSMSSPQCNRTNCHRARAWWGSSVKNLGLLTQCLEIPEDLRVESRRTGFKKGSGLGKVQCNAIYLPKQSFSPSMS